MSKKIIRRKRGESTQKSDPMQEFLAEQYSSNTPKRPVKATSKARNKRPVRTPTHTLNPDALLSELDALGDQGMDALLHGQRPRRFYVGDKVKGKLSRKEPGYLFVDIGAKSEAIMAIANDEELSEAKIGTEIQAYIVQADGRGIYIANQLSEGGTEALEQAMQAGLPIEARVVSANKGGFKVSAFGHHGFCPISHMDKANIDDTSIYIGKKFWFHLTAITPQEFTVSRRKWLQEEQAKKQQQQLHILQVGEQKRATIQSIHDFGIFVLIDGAKALLPKRKVEGLATPPEVGAEYDVVITQIDKEKGQIAVAPTMKDPWLTIGQQFRVGMQYEGKLTSIKDFGLFVQLATGLIGMLHRSNIEASHRNHFQQHFEVGQSIKVTIGHIDHQKRRIELTQEPPDTSTKEQFTGDSKGTVSTLGDLLKNFDL